MSKIGAKIKKDRKKQIILTIIAARGGSRGIPNKNIRPIAGKPLLAYSILPALSLVKKGLLDRLILTTDSSKIAAIGRRYGVETPFLRPHRLATSKSQMRDVLLHALHWLEKEESYRPDYFMLLQPTAPLREEEDITACLKEIKKSYTDAVIVVSETELASFFIKNGYLKKSFDTPNLKKNTNRQSMPKRYIPIGSTFLVRTKTFLKEKTVFPKKTRFVVCPNWRSVDINSPEDLAIAELLLKNKQKINKFIENFQ